MADVFAYFITAFVITTNVPPAGWLQYTQAFTDRAACRYIIKQGKNNLTLQIENQFKEKLVSVETFDCMTREEAVQRNTKLGH